MERFKLTEIQAQAILDMQLKRLAALERQKIEDEHKELVDQHQEFKKPSKKPKTAARASSRMIWLIWLRNMEINADGYCPGRRRGHR